MGKNKHSKDRLYVTRTEQEGLFGGKRGLSAKETGAAQAAAKAADLPLTHCSLSLKLWENPVCTPDGTVFDLMNVVPYIRKYSRHPISGEKLATKELIKLVFHRDSEGKLHCPVLFKVFNKNSHVVAVKTSGNVYSYDAVKELNLKAKNFTDLLTGQTFAKKDIVTLSDPKNLSLRRVADDKVREQALEERKKAGGTSIRLDETATRALAAAAKNTELVDANNTLNISVPKSVGAPKGKHGADQTSTMHSTGRAAAGFTSTTLNPITEKEMRALTEDELREARYKQIKKKGYAKIQTNFGSLNLEIHCDKTPRTAENFLGLSMKGYYNGVPFHRSIPRFVLQGGDPSGTGHGGESLWGSPFPDEIRGSLRHKGKGILSMANSGPSTNGSQFFITYASAPHLDDRHTVFGHVVGGLDVLDRIERVETDEDDHPLEEIVIKSIKVLVNPFADLEKDKRKAEEAEVAKRQKEAAEEAREAMYSHSQVKNESGVGKYLGKVHGGEVEDTLTGGIRPLKRARPAETRQKYGDFSGW